MLKRMGPGIRRTPTYIQTLFALMLVTEGEQRVEVNRQSMTVRPGIAICARPSEVWTWQEEAHIEVLSLGFEEDFLRMFFNDQHFLDRFPWLSAGRRSPSSHSSVIGMNSPAYTVQMVCLLLGIAIQSVGLVLEVRPQVTMMSAEAFVFYVSRRWQQEFGKVKVWFDCSLVLLAVVCSVGFALTNGQSVIDAVLIAVREGSLLAAILTGQFVRLLSRHAAPLDRFLFANQ